MEEKKKEMTPQDITRNQMIDNVKNTIQPLYSSPQPHREDMKEDGTWELQAIELEHQYGCFDKEGNMTPRFKAFISQTRKEAYEEGYKKGIEYIVQAVEDDWGTEFLEGYSHNRRALEIFLKTKGLTL